MKKIQFVTKVILVLYLTSCAPTATTLPATLIPPPTIIPTQTPQPPSPAFLDLQEEIAKSDIYTLTDKGIEMENADGTTTLIPDITINPQDGTFTITYEDNEYLIEFVSLDGQILTFKDEDGNTFVFNGENLVQTLTQEQLDQMTDEEKLAKAPEKMADLTKSNISTVKNNLVIYRDSETNAQKVFDLLTGKELTLPEAGIIELDLTDGGRLEMESFENTDDAIDFIAKKVLWLNENDITRFQFANNWLKSPEAYDFGKIFKKIDGFIPFVDLTLPVDTNTKGESFFSVALVRINQTQSDIKGTYVLFKNQQDEFQSIFISQNASSVKNTMLSKPITSP